MLGEDGGEDKPADLSEMDTLVRDPDRLRAGSRILRASAPDDGMMALPVVRPLRMPFDCPLLPAPDGVPDAGGAAWLTADDDGGFEFSRFGEEEDL
jgi:hypothetical protein